MIPFVIYSLIFLLLIYYNGFFGLFKDEHISPAKYSLLFIGKILAVPVFYIAYERLYGGIQNFDTGKFYNDVRVITGFAKTDPFFYVRLLLGLQDDSPGSYDFENCLKFTLNWDNGSLKDYLYNDNRVVIRVHSLLDFLTFGSYLAHALFSCFLSFIGIHFLYRSIKDYFSGKEIWVLLILCFFPALWFYTGALLKEGICLFVMGCSAFQIRRIVEGNHDWKRFLFLAALLFLSCLLKPYLLLFFTFWMASFFLIKQAKRIRLKSLLFLISVFAFGIAISGGSVLLKGKSLSTAALDHQRQFADMSKGGIFLKDSLTFIRLAYDTNLVKKVEGRKNTYRIRHKAPYVYWELSHVKDTLLCKANADTLTEYLFVYRIAESGSNFEPGIIGGKKVPVFVSSLYYCLFHPMFFNARNALQTLASIENLFIVLALCIILIGFIGNKKQSFLPLVFLTFAMALFVIIGTTAPNSGAIFRYRSPVVIFVFLTALYYLDILVKKITKNEGSV